MSFRGLRGIRQVKRIPEDVAPETDVEWQKTTEKIHSLSVHPNATTSVQDIRVKRGAIGLIQDGLESYLSDRGCGQVEMPETFSSWEAPFSRESRYLDAPIAVMAVGAAIDAEQVAVFGLRSDVCEAAFRAITGGGRFDPDDYTIHAGIPAGVIEGPKGAVAVSPAVEKRRRQIDEEPSFTYRIGDEGDIQDVTTTQRI